MSWDPAQYLRFADHRSRPGLELLARVPDVAASTVVDLGCGPGSLTALLAQRWPGADVVGLDSSAAMLERAATDHPVTDHPNLRWQHADLATWEPDAPVDVVYSNAALHWIDDHARLFPRLRQVVSPDGVVAVQMPDNWAEPTHRVPAEILDDGTWPETARAALLRDRLSAPSDYRAWVQPATVDLWRVTYHQELTGDDPVWHWVTGSVLAPVLAALDRVGADIRDRFEVRCKAAYREAYPADADGTTVLPFSRLFFVAVAP